MDSFAGAGWLIHVAMAAYMVGLFLRDQLLLRVFLLFGTGVYIAYYYLEPATPLWNAIFASLMIGAANLFGLLRLLHSRYFTLLPAAEKQIFAAMPGLQPGEFRRLMRLGELRTETRDVRLTREGVTPDFLYFVTGGAPLAEKGGRRFEIAANAFVGEISFVLDEPASACVTLPAGGAVIRWRREALRAALRRSPQLERAFEALITRDMARKVANGVHIGASRQGAPECASPGVAPALAPGFAGAYLGDHGA